MQKIRQPFECAGYFHPDNPTAGNAQEPPACQSEEKMTIKTHHVKGTKIAELIAEGNIISKSGDGLDLLGNLYYQGFDKIVIHEKNITPDFFDLKNGMAGEILQKFSTYRVRLAIVGDFARYSSKSLKDFIFESNKGRHVSFVSSSAEALKTLSER
ncbi:MAG: DUF4180 domain-containing protein [Bacteroides sp.]|nr:DUF4180 domain-containing protein [Bacteroides sp.]